MEGCVATRPKDNPSTAPGRRRPVPKALSRAAVQLPEAGAELAAVDVPPEVTPAVSSSPPAQQGIDAGTKASGAHQVPAAQCPSGQCAVSVNGVESEIRTKVFRMGAPLLRSTIPVSLGRTAREDEHVQTRSTQAGLLVNDEDDEAETVLSMSDCDMADQGSLAVTMDFPC
mmetsp:Transcript_24609/g.56795  ORF Transcript_24609/g.56795 Transcript_24609/m.56795 type:complete len:171 (+) Transcript_24609:68-580(+)|eukprot:6115492-Amphidinium_carterae.1